MGKKAKEPSEDKWVVPWEHNSKGQYSFFYIRLYDLSFTVESPTVASRNRFKNISSKDLIVTAKTLSYVPVDKKIAESFVVSDLQGAKILIAMLFKLWRCDKYEKTLRRNIYW